MGHYTKGRTNQAVIIKILNTHIFESNIGYNVFSVRCRISAVPSAVHLMYLCCTSVVPLLNNRGTTEALHQTENT